MNLTHANFKCTGRWGQELTGGRLYWSCDNCTDLAGEIARRLAAA